MKVTGPGTGAPGATPEADKGAPEALGKLGKIGQPSPGGAAETGKAGVGAAGRTFAETLAAGRAAPAGGSAPARVSDVDALTADIAADLKAGKLDPKAALDQVVERVLDRQLGANAPVALRTQLRDALRDTISSDPLLADRLRGLG